MECPLPLYFVACADTVWSEIVRFATDLRVQVAGCFRSTGEAVELLLESPPAHNLRPILVISVSGESGRRDVDMLRAIPDALILAITHGEVGDGQIRADGILRFPADKIQFATALNLLTNNHAAPQETGRVIAVSGMTAGVGATTIAALLASEIARRGERVVLGEPSARAGQIAERFAVRPSAPLNDVYTAATLDGEAVARSLYSYSPNLQLLVADPYARAASPAPIADVLRVVDLLRQQSGCAVLDISCTYDHSYFSLLGSADVVVLVTEQRISSVRTTQMILDRLLKLNPQCEVLVTCNRYDPLLGGLDVDHLRRVLNLPAIVSLSLDDTLASRRIHTPSLRSQVEAAQLADRLLSMPRTGASSFATIPTKISGPPADSDRTLRVLHVEDDPVQHLLVRHLLDQVGHNRFDLTTAPGEQEALAEFGPSTDLVVLDYQLTNGNGLSCLRALKRLRPDVPVLVLSGTATSRIAADLIEAGADDAFRKDDLDPQEFAIGVTEALARARM